MPRQISVLHDSMHALELLAMDRKAKLARAEEPQRWSQIRGRAKSDAGAAVAREQHMKREDKLGINTTGMYVNGRSIG